MLIYRYKNEISSQCANKFFKDVNTLFFPGDVMTSRQREHGTYCELFLNGDSCGYAVALNLADKYKLYSHLFSDTGCMFMDEFQCSPNRYCKDEITNFQILHQTVARGQGQASRYVPVYMCSNSVSTMNPYYTAWNIGHRVQANTKFLRSSGVVLEFSCIESIAAELKGSSFNSAFSGTHYQQHATENLYLNDNLAFIERPQGKSRYLCTLRYNDKNFSLREYPQRGIIYCDTSADESFPLKIAVTTDDHQINYLVLSRSSLLISSFRQYFEHGSIRFRDLSAKEAFYALIAIR